MLKENPYSLYGTTDLVSRHLALCTRNQYLSVEVERGIIRRVKKQSRVLGFVTLGISMLFTSPYVEVRGVEDVRNRECLGRIESACGCAVVFCAVEGDGTRVDV